MRKKLLDYLIKNKYFDERHRDELFNNKFQTLLQNVDPGNLEIFDENKNIKPALKDLYNYTRLYADVDDEGNYIMHRIKPRHLIGLHKLVRENIIPVMGNTYHPKGLIPRNIVKQIDHQYADYVKKANELFRPSIDKWSNQLAMDEIEDEDRMYGNRRTIGTVGHIQDSLIDGPLGKYLSLKALNNISSSTNIDKALKEIFYYLSNIAYIRPATREQNMTDKVLHSVKDIRKQNAFNYDNEAEIKKLQEIRRLLIDKIPDTQKDNSVKFLNELDFKNLSLDEQREYIQSLKYGDLFDELTAKDISNEAAKLYTDADNEGNDILMYDRVPYDEQVFVDTIKEIEQQSVPYNYSSDIINAFESRGWHLIRSAKEMKEIGREQNICLSEPYSSGYAEKVREKKSLIAHKYGSDATAEIDVYVDEYDEIISTRVIQIKGYDNEELLYEDETRVTWSDLSYEVRDIATEIVGMKIHDTYSDDEISQKISDIFAKHIIRPASPHLVGAINRRFL